MKTKIMGVSILIGSILVLGGCTWGDGNGGFLRGGHAKKAESAFPETLNTGEVIVQQGAPIIEESPAYVVGQPSIPMPPGVSTQTAPPPLSPQNTLPLSPTPTNPTPKLVPQAQPTPANPTSRIIN
ncbi:MAG: hypothetical protein EBT92_03090 [Planctomycetes bacterium]|nr:hypothetical protein [Planctomycetota bacterium]NBY03723.1 hypothetical protein [Planctomycetota bacterium]